MIVSLVIVGEVGVGQVAVGEVAVGEVAVDEVACRSSGCRSSGCRSSIRDPNWTAIYNRKVYIRRYVICSFLFKNDFYNYYL